MIFATYDEQSSHPGYIDMVFKDLTIKPEYDGKGLPIADWSELLALLKDGYYPDFCAIPEWLSDDHPIALNQRHLKKFAKKVFREYGDSVNATKAHDEFIEWLEAEDPLLAEEMKSGDHIIF